MPSVSKLLTRAGRLADLLVKLGQTQEAQKVLEDYLTIDTDNTDTSDRCSMLPYLENDRLYKGKVRTAIDDCFR